VSREQREELESLQREAATLEAAPLHVVQDEYEALQLRRATLEAEVAQRRDALARLRPQHDTRIARAERTQDPRAVIGQWVGVLTAGAAMLALYEGTQAMAPTLRGVLACAVLLGALVARARTQG
jgi:hypothetical protein